MEHCGLKAIARARFRAIYCRLSGSVIVKGRRMLWRPTGLGKPSGSSGEGCQSQHKGLRELKSHLCDRESIAGEQSVVGSRKGVWADANSLRWRDSETFSVWEQSFYYPQMSKLCPDEVGGWRTKELIGREVEV